MPLFCVVWLKVPGGYSIYPWVGRCGPAPHTLTLFKTKTADFPTLFKTELRFLIPCLRHLTRNHTLCKTIRNIETLGLRQKLIKSIPCLRQKSRKTYPGWPYVPSPPSRAKSIMFGLNREASDREKEKSGKVSLFPSSPARFLHVKSLMAAANV